MKESVRCNIHKIEITPKYECHLCRENKEERDRVAVHKCNAVPLEIFKLMEKERNDCLEELNNAVRVPSLNRIYDVIYCHHEKNIDSDDDDRWELAQAIRDMMIKPDTNVGVK